MTAQHGGGRVDVMQSSGGIIPRGAWRPEPVRTVLSGPAGGVIGACQMARWAGFERIIGFDMGGTSTDVFLADAAGGAQLTRESVVAGVPIGVPMLDIHTAGAGGGSIARFDAGGMLRVGPESAGAEPGPICFGRGTKPTVTDANLLLGRLDAESFLGGGVRLDGERTERIMREAEGLACEVEEFAAGILRVVETQMEKAIRVISIERGYDPRDFTLVAFGGGGPLHACSLARALRIPTRAGSRDAGRAFRGRHFAGGHGARLFAHRDAAGRCDREAGATFRRARSSAASPSLPPKACRARLSARVDLRYRGQGYELNVPWMAVSAQAIEAFHRAASAALWLLRSGAADGDREFALAHDRGRRAVVRLHDREPVPGDGSSRLLRGATGLLRWQIHAYAPSTARSLIPETRFTGRR